MLKLSVVTVCYNAEKTIVETIESVLNQTYANIEYLIIDGKSTDNTLNIVEKYHSNCDNIRVISEKDAGIYNAMNKGIDIASGEYIYFLNAGDLFYNDTTVAIVMDRLKKTGLPDIIYGDIDVDYHTHKKRIEYAGKKRLNRILIALGITVCHQSVFAKTYLMKERGFDEEYKLWADQEWLMYVLQRNVQIETIDQPVCVYDGFGLSASGDSLERVFEESDMITQKYTPVIYWVTKPMKGLLRIYRRVQQLCR